MELRSQVAGESEGTLWQQPTYAMIKRYVKRAIDFVGSIVLIIIFLPVMLLIVTALSISDGRPMLHRRRVIGPKGEFDAFKFRSMRRNADHALLTDPVLLKAFSENFKLKSDPRVTPVGTILRRFSLDELPQLFNVMIGQMSLVGPRMITKPELEKYGEYQSLLLTVKPGLTGYWQVQGRQDVSYAKRVKMDVDYIRGWSLGWDVKILLLTPLRVISTRGAY